MNPTQLLQLFLQLGENAAGGYLGQPTFNPQIEGLLQNVLKLYPAFAQQMFKSAGMANPLLSQYLQSGSPYLARILAQAQNQVAEQYQNQRSQLAQQLASQGFGEGAAGGGAAAAAEGELGRAEADTGAQNFLQGLLANEQERFNAGNLALQEANMFNPANLMHLYRLPQATQQGPLANLFSTAPSAGGFAGMLSKMFTGNGVPSLGGSGVPGVGLGTQAVPGVLSAAGPTGPLDALPMSTFSTPISSLGGALTTASSIPELGSLAAPTGEAGLAAAGIDGPIGGLVPGFSGAAAGGGLLSGIGSTLAAPFEGISGAVSGALGGGSLAGILGTLAGVAPYLAPLALIPLLFHGANPDQVPMAQINQTFMSAGDDILHAAQQGYISADQAKQLLSYLGQSGVQQASQALSQYPKANSKMEATGNDIENGLNALIGQLPTNATSKPFDLSAVQNTFINPTTKGWYSGAVQSGNDLATQLLESLGLGSPTATPGAPQPANQATNLAGALNNLTQNNNGQLTSPTPTNPFAPLIQKTASPTISTMQTNPFASLINPATAGSSMMPVYG